MTRIKQKFIELRRKKSKAFIAFITAGYPSLAATEKLVLEFDRIGVDIVELGVPFSDPMADGPVIQEASEAALAKGVNLKMILQLVKRLRRKTSIPICLMTYYNPVFVYPQSKFVKEAAACGVDGIIVPDLPPEEAKLLINQSSANKLDAIFFVAPTTTPKRIGQICQKAQGFIYYVSLTGVTGIRQKLPVGLTSQLKIIKATTKKPVCVGFGISSNAQVKEIGKISDGVIVGSAIVKKIRENINRPDLAKRVAAFVSCLKGG